MKSSVTGRYIGGRWVKMLNLSITYLFNDPLYSFLHPPFKLGGRYLVFKIWTKRGIMKKLLRNRGVY